MFIGLAQVKSTAAQSAISPGAGDDLEGGGGKGIHSKWRRRDDEGVGVGERKTTTPESDISLLGRLNNSSRNSQAK